MATTELAGRITDEVTAELVDCVPLEPEPVCAAPPLDPEAGTPIERSLTATIEQTGADPPPGV